MARFLGDANLVAATIEGDRVDTPFGPLALRRIHRPPAGSGPAVALVRPEQLTLSTTVGGAGLAGTVVGPSSTATTPLSPWSPGGGITGPITVRAEGDLVVADGTEVELTAGGSRWPGPAGGVACPPCRAGRSDVENGHRAQAVSRSSVPTSWMATRTTVRPGCPPRPDTGPRPGRP